MKYVQGKITEMIGFEVATDAGPKQKEITMLQIIIRASAEIPLSMLDPLAPMKAQVAAGKAGKMRGIL